MADPSSYRPKPGQIPDSPGVYKFRDDHRRVIYVGKAKNLRQRLANYFQDLAGLHPRTRTMVTTAASVHRDRWSSVVLVDGGVALPLPPGVDPADMLAGVLGPALTRLEMTFADRSSYRAFWLAHPALREPGAWNEDTEAWLDHARASKL